MANTNKSQIAIRFGASATSKAPKTSPRPTLSSALGKRTRPQFIQDDDSSGEEEEHAQPESITHFGANGAEYVDDDRLRKDRHRADGRKNARRRTESPADSGRPAPQEADKLEDEPAQWGLIISKKTRQEKASTDEAKEDDVPQIPKTADEEAMDALLGNDKIRKIVPLHRSEDDAYRDAASEAPDVDDLATYQAIPVEGFGASLLMGQGWDGKMRGPKRKEIIRRPKGMGMGAKELKGEEDLGGWDHKGKGGKNDRRPRLDEYRREEDKERDRREARHHDSYKNERDRERDGGRRGDKDRYRDEDRHRDRDRDRDSQRRGDRSRDYRR